MQAEAFTFVPGETDFSAPSFAAWARDSAEARSRLNTSGRPRILLGAGSVLAQGFVRRILESGHVVAMVDNARVGQTVAGVRVIGDTDLAGVLESHDDAIGVLCCSSHGAITHFTRLWGERPQPLTSFLDVMRDWPKPALTGDMLGFVPSFSDIDNALAAHAEVRPLLRDDLSLRTLDALMLYRLTWDARYLMGISRPEKAIYFEPDVMPLHDHETFIDGGAFDGDTVRDFVAKTAGRYTHIHAFEIDPVNIAAFHAGTAGIPRLDLHAMGLWDRPAELGFEHRDDNCSRVSEAAETKVALDALDNLDVGVPTLIKMDIEGAELPALEGARGLISRHKPKLAISIYHRHDDFITLTRAIRSMRDDYSFSLRHYSEVNFDSVIYCT